MEEKISKTLVANLKEQLIKRIDTDLDLLVKKLEEGSINNYKLNTNKPLITKLSISIINTDDIGDEGIKAHSHIKYSPDMLNNDI